MQNPTIYFTAALSLAVGVWVGWTVAKKPKPEKKAGLDDRDAYIRGLKYIISNQPDKAIAEFTRAVQVDSNTIEIYQDLGNLFRERGEVGRAIQIHQSILLRPSLDNEFRVSALMSLGLDYQKGGFIDRAVKVYQEVLQHDSDNLPGLQAVGRVVRRRNGLGKCLHYGKTVPETFRGQQQLLQIGAHHDRNG